MTAAGMTADPLRTFEEARRAVAAELVEVRGQIAELRREASELQRASPHPSDREALVAAHVAALREAGRPTITWNRGALAIRWPDPRASIRVRTESGKVDQTVGAAGLIAWLDPDALTRALLGEFDRAYPADDAGSPTAEREARLAEIGRELGEMSKREARLVDAASMPAWES